MKTRLILTATLPLAALGLAQIAQAAPPADKTACLKLSFSLAERASKAKLKAEDAASVDGMLTKLESECSSGALDKAGASAEAIEKAIAGAKAK